MLALQFGQIVNLIFLLQYLILIVVLLLKLRFQIFQILHVFKGIIPSESTESTILLDLLILENLLTEVNLSEVVGLEGGEEAA